MLGWGVYLKIIVTVILMPHLCEPDGLPLAVEYGYGLRIGGCIIVREPPAAAAQVVVAFILCNFSSVAIPASRHTSTLSFGLSGTHVLALS